MAPLCLNGYQVIYQECTLDCYEGSMPVITVTCFGYLQHQSALKIAQVDNGWHHPTHRASGRG